ncbi:MAG: transporter [Candidatus Omnitrophica bacterium]|nr:transporter [Candidatus Omnitrophota bacterium]
MKNKFFFILYLFLGLMLVNATSVLACESCLLSRTGRDESQVNAKSADSRLLFKYWFERQDWKSMDLNAAHELHHDGHHVHVKTSESIQHLGAGYIWNKHFLTTLDLPYVRRKSLEVHSHANMGKEYTSQGFGDVTVSGIYDFWKTKQRDIGVVVGVKVPTGSTHEINPQGARFESEMQPGTGSWDYHLGGVYQQSFTHLDLTANMLYVFKNEGAQNYQFGNVFSTTVFIDYIPPQNTVLKNVRPGIMMNWKDEARHEDRGEKESDSGGSTVFLGPELSLSTNDYFKVFVNFQWPVYQDLGGVHQEVDKIWNLGTQVRW